MKKISIILLVVLMVSLLVVSVSAETISIGEDIIPTTLKETDGTVRNITDVVASAGANDTFAIFEVNGNYFFYVVPNSSLYYFTGDYKLTNGTQTVLIYRYIPGELEHFAFLNTNVTNIIGKYSNGFVPTWSSYDIGDGNGGVHFSGSNFPVTPLAVKIQGVTTEVLETKTLPTLAGTMTTLTLCGVGLMALLVVLSLFGKRSLIFLSR